MWPENTKGNSVFAFRRGLETEIWLRSTEAGHELFRDSKKQERGEKVIFQLEKKNPVAFT